MWLNFLEIFHLYRLCAPRQKQQLIVLYPSHLLLFLLYSNMRSNCITSPLFSSLWAFSSVVVQIRVSSVTEEYPNSPFLPLLIAFWHRVHKNFHTHQILTLNDSGCANGGKAMLACMWRTCADLKSEAIERLRPRFAKETAVLGPLALV